jgi:hypothetical protein
MSAPDAADLAVDIVISNHNVLGWLRRDGGEPAAEVA